MVRDYSSIARALMGEWNKTSQPLKERGVIADRDTSGWGNLIDVPEDHPTISWARGINALGGLAGGVGKFGAEVIDSMLPLGTYEDGSAGLAVPSIVQTPIDGLRNFGQYGYGEEAVPYNSRMAFDAAGGAMTGGLATGVGGGLVDNAAGIFGGRLAKTADMNALGSAGGKLRFSNVTRDPSGENIAFIERDGQPYGQAIYTKHGDAVNVENLTVPDGSNALGLGGLRALREAFREIEPRATRFMGDRIPEMKTGPSLDGARNAGQGVRRQSLDIYSNAPTGSSVPLAMNALERAQPALASRDMQQMARSLGYDPQRVRSWASDKINELSRSTWDSDKAEAARLGQLLQELDADPNALASIRQSERSSVLQSQAQRQQNKTERPIANRDGYQIVRRDDPDVGALNFDVLGPDGGSVGSAKMSAAQGQVETPEIGWVGIDEGHQRKGLASWLYDEIERDIGQKLWPSPELISPEIQAFWQKRDPDRLARMLDGTYANAPTGSSVPMAMNALERAQPQGIRAYHGSPHAFDRFSLDKIGTGEGNAAYGHGIYLAESEGVAKSYREGLAGWMLDGQPLDTHPLSWLDTSLTTSARTPQDVRGVLAEALSNEVKRRDEAAKMKVGRGQQGFQRQVVAQAQQGVDHYTNRLKQLDDYLASNPGEITPGGHMYEVNINAQPEQFINYDALDDAARRRLEDPAEAARLREQGYAGIRYLDGMSRDGGSGTSNYVVFDDALIDILRKYANAPTGAAVPLGMEGQQDTDPALLEYLKAIGLY
jgi:hypothetical protein